MAVIVICDDVKEERELAIREVTKYNEGCEEENHLTIREYASSESLWFELAEKDVADIFLLDIDMPGMDGLELARKIRENNAQSLIIFLTSHIEFASEGYKVAAFRYIHKLNLERDLPEALMAAMIELQKDSSAYVLLKFNDELIRLPFSDIRYVQRVGRKLEIHTLKNGVIESNQGIKELYEKLDSVRFIFIDRGCFVNIDYIARVTGGNIWLSATEEKLPISRRLQTPVKEAIAKGWKL